jgi:eukaryotic-like serine/threonine-protein kinase
MLSTSQLISMQGSKIHSHYDITKFLGLGRFGETYLAKSKDLPGRPDCVVKRFCFQSDPIASPLANRFTNPLALIAKSFDEQVEVLYRLGQHDRIPTVLAQLVDGENFYLVQEYVDGELLGQELKPGQPWSQSQVIELLQDTLGTLEFLHHQNFIHQDINPANWMRRWRDGKFVLLGCSGAKDQASIWQQPVDDRPLELVGTPGYIPFEQEDKNPQFNTDIYALGVIAIQALTGTFPIERHPDTYELSWRHLTDANLKLVEIVDRMVRPDYRNRYQLVREVLDDLEKFVALRRRPSAWDNLRPHLIFGSAAGALMLGLAIPKLLPMTGEPAAQPQSVQASQPIAASQASQPMETSKSIEANSALVAPGSWLTHQADGLQISYDPQWEKQETPNLLTGERATFFSPASSSGQRAQISLRMEELAAITTLSSYTEQSIAEIKKFLPNAKIIEAGSSKLADRPAYVVTYSGLLEGKEVKNLEIWTVAAGRAHIVQYQAPAADYYQHLQTAMASIGTFKIDR